jgi:hypothetical protein
LGALSAVALSLLACACLWRSYEEIMTVHLEVMASMMAKAVDGAAPLRRPSASEVSELRYPLRRARQFTGQYEAERERRSYQAFVSVLDLYERFVDSIDVARTEERRWAALEPELAERRREIDARIAAVRAALTAEG